MRIRATVAAVTGALALSAFVVPAAQAASPGAASLELPSAAEQFGVSSNSAFATAEALPTVSNVTVNSGKAVAVGATAAKKFTVSLTASHASGIYGAVVFLWHGADQEHVDGFLGSDEETAACTATSATTSTCKATITALPGTDLYKNALAGTWKVYTAAISNDGDLYENYAQKTAKVQRLSKLTVNAAPEPVKKGKTITVTGKLSRANWETGTYSGYATQPVTLQFRKKSVTSYTNVKGIKSTSTGALKTTTTASVDGYYRFTYAGSATTSAVSATGDYIDVQ